MQILKDVEVPGRAGPIVVDVFRPDGDEPVPVIACISPYGKDVHWPERFPLYDLVEQGDHMTWETPNPEWWTERGYAVVRADSRGTGKTKGRLDPFSPTDAEDFYDLVEWCGTQSWSTGKVASSGISWYAMMGWRVAALQPPHLAALVAWEGMNDFYREWARQGGLATNGFTQMWWNGQVEVQRNTDDAPDWYGEIQRRELDGEYYRERSADLSRVEVPLLSAGNWGALHLHLRGNLEGWAGAASEHKWLVVYSGTHIDPYYTDWGKDLQLRFLDRFLKGREDATDGMPPVRLALRRGREVEWRDEHEWPLARTQWRELHLGSGTLAFDPPAEGETPYPGTFEYTATDTVELTGPVALRLWVTSQQEDFDVFARLDHLDVDGNRIEPIGPQGPPTPVPAAMGWLRASHRKLDPQRTLPYRPYHAHDEIQPLVAGEPTLLEVEIWPTSITLRPGERLRLELRVDDSDLTWPAWHDDPDDHRPARDVSILVGGRHASHLLLPVIPT
ncbi:MAG TPA: CocE/NonD family hydrolase [Blastococcus sp.]|nr:CocE/NonD family hydrolase [Blastococcus sp.]